jgi:uncharacterized protein
MGASSDSTPLVLELDELAEGVTDLAFEVPSSALGLSDPYLQFGKPVSVTVRLRRALETYRISGTARTEATGECCRCLAGAVAEVSTDLHLLLQRKQASEDELEAAEEEVEVEIVPPGTRLLDLTELIHDALLLDVPLRVYCQDDCQGLCVQCGQNLNQSPCSCSTPGQDPRWSALKDLKLT